MKAEFSETFRRFQPLCSNLPISANLDDITKLRRALQELDRETFQTLQEYVIFPCRVILHKDSRECLRIQCIDLLKFVFDNTRVTNLNLFCDLLIQLFKFISGPDISEVSKASEELKYAVCECITSMMYSSCTEIHKYVYSLEFCPFLGHSVFVLVGLLKYEKSKSLRISIVRTISAFTYCSSDNRFREDETMSVSAGDRLAAFLPGVSQALWAVICGDPKQGHIITVAAIHTWTKFIALTLGDCYIKDPDDKRQISANSQNSNLVPCVERNSTWAKDAAEKIEIQIGHMMKLVCHDHWKVRLALAQCAETILLKCSKSLENCVSLLLNGIFALSVDTYDQVSSIGKKAASLYARHVEKMESKSVLMIAEDEVLMISNQLIKNYLKGDDSQILSLLRTLHGYLQMLGSSVDNILCSPPHLNRLLISLLHITELDCSEVNLLAENSVSLDFSSESVATLWPKKSFRNFKDPEVMLRVSFICELLGHFSNVRLLIDYLLEKFSKCDEYRKQAVLLILLIIKGLPNSSTVTEDLPHSGTSFHDKKNYIIELISDILEEFLSSNYWALEISSNDTENQTLNVTYRSFAEMNSSIIQVCLLLEAVATFSSVLGSNFRPLLLSVLCPVMEKAGNSNMIISQTGKTALSVIASSCEFKSVEQLILQNSDYLVNSLAINLQQYTHRLETGVVLRVVLDHCSIDILPLFRDPIYKLLDILDYNVSVRQSVLQILNSVVVAIKNMLVLNKNGSNLMCSEQTACSPDSEESKHVDSGSSILHRESAYLKDSLLQYHHMKQSEDNDCEDISDDPSHTENVPMEDSSEVSESKDNSPCSQETSSKPFHVEVVVKILERCVHLQSSKNIMLCLLSLDIITCGIEALSDFPDDLLPVVHKIWNPFVLRFNQELVVRMQAFKTLVVIANKCGDFVRSRTLKDIWPHVLSFLEMQRAVSLGKVDSSPYRFTQAFKYQHLLLTEMGHLARMLDVSEKDIESIALSCLSYLDKNQPAMLQKAAYKAVQDIACLDADAMWFYFEEAFSNNKLIEPPHFSLQAVHFSGYLNSNYPQNLQL